MKIFLLFVVVTRILASTDTDKNENRNTYARKTGGNAEFSMGSTGSKVFTPGDNREHIAAKGDGVQSEQSKKVSDNDNSALGRFLENVLKAQDDLKWIDETVRNINHVKDREKSPGAREKTDSETSHLRGTSSVVNVGQKNVLREKRGFDRNDEILWSDKKKSASENLPGHPQRVYLENEMLKRDTDFDDFDASQNNANGREIRTDSHNSDGSDVQIPNGLTKTEDLCFLNDWLSRNSDSDLDKQGDRWINNYEDGHKSRFNSDEKLNGGFNVRNQRDEAKKEEPPSLESLRETVLELKKSLNEGDKNQYNDPKNIGSSKMKEKKHTKEDSNQRKTRGKMKQDERETDDEDWWASSGPDTLNIRKREEIMEDDGRNALKAWRTKRTEINSDEDSPKLYRRAGFGETYREDDAKVLHDRERRSKGTRSDEKRHLSKAEAGSGLGMDAKDSIEISKKADCNDADSSNSQQDGRLTNDVENSGKREGGQSKEADENDARSDPVQTGLNVMEKESTKNRENPGGDSLQAYESMTNELQPASAATSTSSTNVDRGETRVQKAAENRRYMGLPQGQADERVEDNEKLQGEDKRSSADSGNVNILLKTENKNMIKFSNAGGGETGSDKNKEQPFVMNRLDVKRKLIMENEDKPGKSVSTIFNVKIEKSEMDAPVRATQKRVRDNGRFAKGVLDPGTNKANEEPYEDGFANDLKQRNVDEARLKNSEFNKGSARSGDNEGPRNWYEGVAINPLLLNIDQTVDGNKEGCEKDKFEEGRFRDDKGARKSIEDSNDDSGLNYASWTSKDKIKEERVHDPKDYKEIVIVPDVREERKVREGYVGRKVLQYMEYSNDDVEDADADYSDKEEEDKQAAAEDSGASVKRKERSTSGGKKNPVKAKVNMLIKEKMDKKKKTKRSGTRKRRAPINIIEYYDYDSNNEQQEPNVLSGTNGDQRMKNNYDSNVIEPNPELAVDCQSCASLAEKKNEHAEAMKKQQREREKLKNVEPKQEFLSPESLSQPKNYTENSNAFLTFSELPSKTKLAEEDGPSRNQQQPGRLDQGEGNVNGINRWRLNQLLDGKEDLEGDVVALDPVKYILNQDKNSDDGTIDDFLEDILSMDQKNEQMPSNVEPLYEELKKLYDWKIEDDESKFKPRLKGDQRMNYVADDKLDLPNTRVECTKSQVESPKIQDSKLMHDSSPNLLPLLQAHDGGGKSEIDETSNSAVSFGQLATTGPSNVSQSNYFALKSTDDMFKGGSEQSNNTGEKLRGSSAIGTAAEWRAQKVNAAGNERPPEKDAAAWSLTGQRQYIDRDSRSPYENRKYRASRLPREHVQNIDRGEQTVISSGDLRESFVEPLDWIDDFDQDTRVRLSRGLKTVEDANSNANAVSNVTNVSEREKLSTSASDTKLATVSVDQIKDNGEKMIGRSEIAKLDSAAFRPSDVEGGGSRVRRDILSASFDTFYDDANENQPDSERMDYSRHLKNREAVGNQLFDSYEDGVNRELDEDFDSYDNLGNSQDYDDEKVVRSVGSRRKKKKRAKNKKHRSAKKNKRKEHADKSEYSSNHRKRRHHKKHAGDSKTKKHDDKKHKKRTSKNANHHGNVKKNKSSRDEEDLHDKFSKRKKHQDDSENQNTMTRDSDSQGRKISMLLSADNVEDESQMDSALHGELAGKIVEQIFDQVQRNEDLKILLGPGLYQKHKTDDTVSTDKKYRQALNDDEIKHTEELLKKVMVLLNQLIFDEVQRKTCVSMPPDLVEFLEWMLDVNPQKNSFEQVPSLPLIHDEKTPSHFPRDKFLFHGSPDRETEAEIDELHRKLRLMRSLIREYAALSEKEKTKVQSVHDYLANQLDLLLAYIETKEMVENGKKPSMIGASKGRNGGIIQYQIGTSNMTNRTYPLSTDTFAPLTNAPSLLKLSNIVDTPYFYDNGIDIHRKGRRIIRSLDEYPKEHKKQRKRGVRESRESDKSASAIDQSPRKGTVASSRQKRGYLDKDFWDSFDSEYEEPLIYTFIDGVVSNERDETSVENARYRKDGVIKEAGEMSRSLDDRILKSSDSLRKRELEKLMRTVEHTTKAKKNTPKSTGNVESPAMSTESNSFKEEYKTLVNEEEAITGKSQVEDEVILLNKRQSWRKENEEQLEEVAFGEDMRKASKDKELFEKLTEIDKDKTTPEPNLKSKEKNGKTEDKASLIDSTNQNREHKHDRSRDLSDEEKLKMLEQMINVYSD